MTHSYDQSMPDTQHCPFTTVKEALWLSGRLRADRSVSNETVMAFIEEVTLSTSGDCTCGPCTSSARVDFADLSVTLPTAP